MLALGLLVAAVALGLALRPLDGWQRLYAITLALLLVAGSLFEFSGLAFYPRYVAAALLAVWSWTAPAHGRQKLEEQRRETRLLINGMYGVSIIAALSVLWSFDPVLSAQQAAAIGILTAVIHGLATGRWCDNPVEDERDQRQAVARIIADLNVAFWVVTLVAVAGLVGEVSGTIETRTVVPEDRYRGLFDNPNLLALVCSIAIPIGFASYAQTRRCIYLFALVPLAVSLALSESRTALVAIAVGLLWALPKLGFRVIVPFLYWLALGTTLALILAPGTISGLRSSAIAQRFSNDEGGLSGRTVAWADAIDVWARKPLTGHGYGAGPELFDELYRAGAIQFRLGVAHNSYLQWFVETGLLGVIPLAIVVIAIVRSSLRQSPSPGGRWLSIVPIAGLAACATESAMFGTGQPFPYLFWIVALAVTCLAPRPVAAAVPSRVSMSDRRCS